MFQAAFITRTPFIPHSCSLTLLVQRGVCKQCNAPRDPNAELVDPAAAKTDWSSLHVEEGISPCDTLIVKVCARLQPSPVARVLLSLMLSFLKAPDAAVCRVST